MRNRGRPGRLGRRGWPLLLLGLTAAGGGEVLAAKTQRLVVFDVQVKRVRLKKEVVSDLRDYLAQALAASRAFHVVPKDKLRQALKKEKKRSYKQCFARGCQVKIGRSLSANQTLATSVTKLGRTCVVSAVVYNLETEVTAGGAQAKGMCDVEGIMASMDSVVKKLVEGGPAPPAPDPTPAKPVPASPALAAAKVSLRWIALPGGKEFVMDLDPKWPSRTTIRVVRVSAFSLTKTEVTVDQYQACVRAGACSGKDVDGHAGVGELQHKCDDCNWGRGRGQHPMNCLDWKQARAFCTWVGGRLPSEAEWEYAARSGGLDQAYPWGTQEATCSRAVMKDDSGEGCGKKQTWPVCSKTSGNSKQGLCDMAGNVWEWTEDCHHPSFMPPPTDSSAWTFRCTGGALRMVRGGSLLNPASKLKAGNRNRFHPDGSSPAIGFRCAK